MLLKHAICIISYHQEYKLNIIYPSKKIEISYKYAIHILDLQNKYI